MNLTQAKTLFDRFKWIVLATAVFIFLLFLIYARYRTKTAPAPPTIINITQSETAPLQTAQTVVSFTGTPPTIPLEMNYLNFTATPISQEQATQFAKGLGFTSEPIIIPAQQAETILLWGKQDETLTVHLNARSLSYENAAQPAGLGAIAPDEADRLTKEFLNKIGLSRLDLKMPTPSFLKDLSENAQPVSFEEGKYTILNYQVLVNSLPAIFDQNTDANVKSVANPARQLQRISINLPPDVNQKSGPEYPTKNFETLLEELKSGRGFYLSSSGKTPRFATDTQPKVNSLEITSAQVEYLMSKEDQNFIPVIAFSATASLNTGQTEIVLIVLPLLENVKFE